MAKYSPGGANLKGKVVVVTGCNVGIGKETARVLYGQGAIVVMACRNLEKATAAKEDIVKTMGADNKDNLIIIRVDLADLKTIDEFVAGFNANDKLDGRLDVLVCNAGVMAFPEFGTTKDGCERQFGINHMGHFYLVNKLLSVLKRNRSRVVMLSSCANYEVPTLDDFTCWLDNDAAKYKGPTENFLPYEWAGFRYYYVSKLCNVLMARQMNQLYGADGITTLALHPGAVNTNLDRNTAPTPGLLLKYSLMFIGEIYKFCEVDQGAAASMYAICVSDEEIFGGPMRGVDRMNYFIDDARFREDKVHIDIQNGQNRQLDEQLWKYSCDLIRSCDYLSLAEE